MTDSIERSSTPVPALLTAAPALVEATELAWRWHGMQTRKGKPISYMSHLLQVQGLVIEAGGGPAEAIAALLHDSLEDATNPAERVERESYILSRFGPSVLQIVLDCTDTTADEAGNEKGAWRVRKERYLSQLRRAESPSLLVAACDKRHNLGDLVSDLRQHGPETLSRFNAGGTEQIWYYAALTSILRASIPHRLGTELDDLLLELRRLVDFESDPHHGD